MQVSFVEAYYTVVEGEGVQHVCVELTGALETSVSVRVDTQPGSALGMPNTDLHMQLVFIIIDIVVCTFAMIYGLAHSHLWLLASLSYVCIILAGEDFIQIWQTLVFDNSTNTTQCLYIPIINDECVESEPEEFTATLYTDNDCVSFGTNSTTISIFDDDCECSYYFVTKLWSHSTLGV